MQILPSQRMDRVDLSSGIFTLLQLYRSHVAWMDSQEQKISKSELMGVRNLRDLQRTEITPKKMRHDSSASIRSDCSTHSGSTTTPNSPRCFNNHDKEPGRFEDGWTTKSVWRTASVCRTIIFSIQHACNYLTVWILAVLCLHLVFGFFETYKPAIRATLLHVSITGFQFTYVGPCSLRICGGIHIDGWFLRIGDMFLHHLPCLFFLYQYHYVENKTGGVMSVMILNGKNDVEMETSPLWNFVFYVIYRVYMEAYRKVNVAAMYGVKLWSLYITYVVCLLL